MEYKDEKVRIIGVISITSINIWRTGINDCISSYNSISVIVYGDISASVNISRISAYVRISVTRISNISGISIACIVSVINFCARSISRSGNLCSGTIRSRSCCGGSGHSGSGLIGRSCGSCLSCSAGSVSGISATLCQTIN